MCGRGGTRGAMNASTPSSLQILCKNSKNMNPTCSYALDMEPVYIRFCPKLGYPTTTCVKMGTGVDVYLINCLCVCMHACIYIWQYVCVYVCMCVCVYVCMCVCVYIYLLVHLWQAKVQPTKQRHLATSLPPPLPVRIRGEAQAAQVLESCQVASPD